MKTPCGTKPLERRRASLLLCVKVISINLNAISCGKWTKLQYQLIRRNYKGDSNCRPFVEVLPHLVYFPRPQDSYKPKPCNLCKLQLRAWVNASKLALVIFCLVALLLSV